ncbi:MULTISPECIES: hypothetical protein [Enterobacteriaceae]|nr:hypothetical protein [Enterobacter sp. Ag1]
MSDMSIVIIMLLCSQAEWCISDFEITGAINSMATASSASQQAVR